MRWTEARLLAVALAVDFLADQRTSRCAQQGARRPVAMRIHSAADQRAAGAADDQTRGAIGLAAVGAAIAAPPFAIFMMLMTRAGAFDRQCHGHRNDEAGGCEPEYDFPHFITPSVQFVSFDPTRSPWIILSEPAATACSAWRGHVKTGQGRDERWRFRLPVGFW